MIPEQELFDMVYQKALDLGYTVYDHLPLESENAPYPFVNLGDTQLIPIATKTGLRGTATITLNVWGNGESRYQVAQMIQALSNIGNGYLLTDNFRFIGRPSRADRQIMTDTSVPDTVLMHGIITLVFDLT